ncbi:VWA domain-containing protein [Porifericola rhodea]|uniref:vWA domain-containing protein n=1 Tax=Porifericola rhodea TaxID=930972 RepID=UPI002666D868|nr:VWA domain-containing protein [Porifericola rhodea]WKN29642.1 VWA domain-containing protein [Porifericola rhodea]
MDNKKLERWRLVLGGDQADGTGMNLSGDFAEIDQVLSALYEEERSAGLGASSPKVSRWLGDIRTYFPKSVVQVMQQDAFKRLNLNRMLMEPEMLELVEPDVHLVANLLTLSRMIPDKTKDTARQVVRKVVEQLMNKLATPMQQAVSGSLNRAVRNRRPRHAEIDWNATILKNLKHYQKDYKTIIPETRVGYGRKRRTSMKDIILCVDQSGSMASSVVYSGIFGAVMASMPAVSTKMIVFDTAVVDLTEDLQDPVDLLFGVQLGGGTDINRALAYCQQLTTRPDDTVLVLITDLYEGGNEQEMRKKIRSIIDSGVQLIVLLALNDEGKPYYDHRNATFLAENGVPAFSCSPDLFPDLMAAAIQKQDMSQWAAMHDISTAKA